MPSPDDLKSWYSFLLNIDASHALIFYTIGALIIIPCLIRVCKKEIRVHKKIKSVLADYGNEYTGTSAQWVYIPARFQSSAPEQYPDLSDSVRIDATQDLISFYIKQVLVKNNKDKHWYMILGGSGMGKSSFVVQLVKEYYHRYTLIKPPYELALVPCGSTNIIERINQIPQKNESVLILDALDESKDAIDHFDTFIVNLENAFQEFHLVIVTCRTQFFEGGDSIRQYSAIPAQTKDKGYMVYKNQFIAPFTDQEIETFLRKKYLLDFKKKRRAKDIVHQNLELMVRPLLLSYIDDLVSYKKKPQNNVEVYHALIDRWITREANFEPDVKKRKIISEAIYEMSVDLAVGIYNNWNNTGGLFLPNADYTTLEQKYLNQYSIAFHFRGRSLINWDAEGNRKFAHKTFLEYFLAERMVRDGAFSINTSDLEEVSGFYKEMCDAILKKEVSEQRIKLFTLNLPRPFVCMSIKAQPKCEYRLLLQRPDMLVIDWSLFSNEMLTWLMTVGASLLIISKYRTYDNYKEFANVKGVQAIYFFEPLNPPSQRLQKFLAKNGISYNVYSEPFFESDYFEIAIKFLLRRGQTDWFNSFNRHFII